MFYALKNCRFRLIIGILFSILMLTNSMPAYADFFSKMKEDFFDATDTVANAGKSLTDSIVSSDSSDTDKLKTEKDLVKNIQKNLRKIGYKPGPVDGDFGKGTQTALEKFQKDYGLRVSGKPNKRSARELAEYSALTPKERKLRREMLPYSNLVVEGAAIGFAVGAGASLLMGGDVGDAVKGGGVGAVLGGGAGYALKSNVKGHKQETVSLDSRISEIRKRNAGMLNAIKTAKSIIADDKKKIAKIKKKLAAGKINEDEAEDSLETVDGNVDFIKSSIRDLKKSTDQSLDKAQELNSKKAEQDCAKLEKEIKSLEMALNELLKSRKITAG